MNFTRLLAAGRSVKGIKKDPGPYRMNQEHLLPRFDARAQKTLAEVLEEEPVPAPPQTAVEDQQAAVVAAASSGSGEPKKQGIFARLAKRLTWWSRRSSGPRSAAKPSRLVQAELSLDALRVVRNDLKDSDFEVVAVPAGMGNGSSQASGRHPTAVGVVWNRLSARLLRQAVQDFNFVQKERGKLLSSAGSDRRSP